MKKFFTVVPLQLRGNLSEYRYEAVGNEKLQMKTSTRFPIVTAICGYVQPGESFRVIAVCNRDESCRRNLELLREELSAFCETTGAVCANGIEVIETAIDDRVSAHLDTFEKLLDFADDGDHLFADMTYGTKPTSQILMMAVQYAYRVKNNTALGAIVYGQIDRSTETPTARVYDMTAMLQMDEIVRTLADRKVERPESFIRALLSL